MSGRLTSQLLALQPELFRKATTHPFLQKAGEYKLTRSRLEAWLTQDRLYITGGYVHLMGALLQKISVTVQGPAHADSRGFSHKLRVITAALSNIDRELKLFEDTAERYGLKLDVRPSNNAEASSETSLLHEATKKYLSYIREMTGPDASWGDGLVLLWAMEIVYLQAWRFALAHQSVPAPTDGDRSKQDALETFIKNWTCAEFEVFVSDIAELVNELDTSNTKICDRYKKIWTNILELEVAFWETADP